VRKLFGSNKKGKRILDKAVKDAYSIGDTGMDDNHIGDIGLEDYHIDDIIMEEGLLDGVNVDEHFTDDITMDEYPVDDSFAEEYPVDAGDADTFSEELPVDRDVTEEQPEDSDAPKKWVKIKSRRIPRPLGRKHIIYASMIIVGVFFAAAALRLILSDIIEDAAARTEYDQLREDFPQISGQTHEPEEPSDDNEASDVVEEDITEEERAFRDLSLDELAAINRDFVGWITANNSIIDYPVVRGADNDHYINTTFFGSRNSAGSIFMDFRNTRGFDESVVILYGHRTRDGSMFTSLVNHLDPEFRRKNPNINVLTRDGRQMTYVIFAAKLTDAWDPAYSTVVLDATGASGVFPNAPANATHFLLLSTCTASNDDDERILVFAALS